MRTVFFAGSFNPFTKGHADIVKRLLKIFDRVIIGIGINAEKPASRDVAEKNAQNIINWVSGAGLKEKVDVLIYTGLTAETALNCGAICMARGVRNATDFDYEFSLASINREAFGIETILIPAKPSLSCVSSSVIRDLQNYGREDIAGNYLPESTETRKE